MKHEPALARWMSSRGVRPNWTRKLNGVLQLNECAFRSDSRPRCLAQSRRRFSEVKNGLIPPQTLNNRTSPGSASLFVFACLVYTLGALVGRHRDVSELALKAVVFAALCSGLSCHTGAVWITAVHRLIAWVLGRSSENPSNMQSQDQSACCVIKELHSRCLYMTAASWAVPGQKVEMERSPLFHVGLRLLRLGKRLMCLAWQATGVGVGWWAEAGGREGGRGTGGRRHHLWASREWRHHRLRLVRWVWMTSSSWMWIASSSWMWVTSANPRTIHLHRTQYSTTFRQIIVPS